MNDDRGIEDPSESLHQFVQSLFKESDRGCVLIFASRLDESLEDLHRAYIKSTVAASRKLLDRLFATHAPLSTFAARIQLAHCYGLVSKADYQDLETLRQLRNAAAHSSTDFSFRSSETQKHVLSITAPKRPHTFPGIRSLLTQEESDALEKPSDHEEGVKLYFLLAGMFLLASLLFRTLQSQWTHPVPIVTTALPRNDSRKP
ncbi:MAG: MltR family transcriptional regulator [Verrucomicrobiales bacterium]|nr:MltR family transcriptional regulator [Verrucomicrobiales bacterium]